MDIYCHRSQIKVGEVKGECDFTTNDTIEIKHAGAEQDWHSHQARIYHAIRTDVKGNAYVVNTKLGHIHGVDPLPTEYVRNVSRTIFCLKYASVINQRLPNKIHLPVSSEIYISVDLEYSSKAISELSGEWSGPRNIYEIGAVAYHANSDRVISVFHRIWNGTSEMTLDEIESSTDQFERLTGLRRAVVDDGQDDRYEMIREFKEWVDGITPNPTYVVWGRGDLQLLHIWSAPFTIDAMSRFRAWLDSTGQGRNVNYTLTDAVQQCLGVDVPFEAHRAFEDAVLTAAVLTSITHPGGTL
jgi:DNA polymerase III epsilon subunit-like protein